MVKPFPIILVCEEVPEPPEPAPPPVPPPPPISPRLICRTPKFDHISPVLHTLHWLPVEERIEYKLLLLAFKSVNNDGPSYLSDFLKFCIPSRQLRSSSDSSLLRIPPFRLKSLGQCEFSDQPLSYGTPSRTHSVIRTLNLPSNLL